MSLLSIRPQRRAALLAAAAALLVTPGAVRADPPAESSTPAPVACGAAPSAALERRLRELEETVRRLTETVQQLQAEKAAAKPTTPARVSAPRGGFSVESPDGSSRLRLHGYAQALARVFTSDSGTTGLDTLSMRRVRPILEGTAARYVDFRIMPDFGQGKATIQDAYGELNYWSEARLRGGKFKVPFSLERLQSGEDLLFVERSIANNLAPDRDVGFQLGGDLFHGVVEYAAGGFNGAPDGGSLDTDVGNDKDFAGRVFVQPYRNREGFALQGLGLGVGLTFGERDDSLSGLAYQTAGRSAFFTYGSSAVEARRTRYAPQLSYYHGPFGLMGEYLLSRGEVSRSEGTKTVKADLTNRGWFVQGSYVLTGEDASYGGVVPKKPFDPRRGRWGALELAARYSRVDIDDDTFRLGFSDPTTSAGRARAYTLGLNWYLNRALRLQLNYERTDFDRKIDFGTLLGRNAEDVFLSELQVEF